MTRVIFQQCRLLLYFITLVSIPLSLPLCNMGMTIVIPGTGENKNNMNRVLKTVQNKSFKLSTVYMLKFSTASSSVIFFPNYIFPSLALKSFHEVNPRQCSCLESQGWESLVGRHLWGSTESDTTDATQQQQQQQQQPEVNPV